MRQAKPVSVPQVRGARATACASKSRRISSVLLRAELIEVLNELFAMLEDFPPHLTQ